MFDFFDLLNLFLVKFYFNIYIFNYYNNGMLPFKIKDQYAKPKKFVLV